MFSIIFNACVKNKLNVIESFIAINKSEKICLFEEDGDPIAFVIENKGNSPVYFSSYNGLTLKYQTFREYYENEPHNTYNGDFFEAMNYDLLLHPNSIDTFYLCSSIDTAMKRTEFILDYKIKEQEDTLSVSIYN
ncbi:MAG TPA: hypothetical protein VFG10_11515 [Saprospiraceae bacterium]|nr:hypothetical protein [Saprospiraceae bacterium]